MIRWRFVLDNCNGVSSFFFFLQNTRIPFQIREGGTSMLIFEELGCVLFLSQQHTWLEFTKPNLETQRKINKNKNEKGRICRQQRNPNLRSMKLQ